MYKRQFSRLAWKAESFSLCPQAQINTSSPPLLYISIRLWQTGHLAFVVLETVSLYPHSLSWQTSILLFFPFTARSFLPHWGHVLFVIFSCQMCIRDSVQPALEDLASQIYESQTTDGITFSADSKYTSVSYTHLDVYKRQYCQYSSGHKFFELFHNDSPFLLVSIRFLFGNNMCQKNLFIHHFLFPYS